MKSPKSKPKRSASSSAAPGACRGQGSAKAPNKSPHKGARKGTRQQRQPRGAGGRTCGDRLRRPSPRKPGQAGKSNRPDWVEYLYRFWLAANETIRQDVLERLAAIEGEPDLGCALDALHAALRPLCIGPGAVTWLYVRLTAGLLTIGDAWIVVQTVARAITEKLQGFRAPSGNPGATQP